LSDRLVGKGIWTVRGHKLEVSLMARMVANGETLYSAQTEISDGDILATDGSSIEDVLRDHLQVLDIGLFCRLIQDCR
jgi:hypothetical protein